MEKTYIFSPARAMRAQSRTQPLMDAARKAWQKIQEKTHKPDQMDRLVFYTTVVCGLIGFLVPWATP